MAPDRLGTCRSPRPNCPTDPAALRAFALACQDELKAAETAVQLKALEIEKLRFQIAKLRRMQFGRSSERITRQIEQLEFQLEELETGEAEDAARDEATGTCGIRVRSRATSRSASRCPIICRARMLCISPPVTAPAAAPLWWQAWPSWARTSPRCWITCRGTSRSSVTCGRNLPAARATPSPRRRLRRCRRPRGRATPATLAHLLVAKYCDHLPLYRQSEIYAREGLELDRSTLCDWVGQAAWLLDPVVAAIRRHVFAAEKIHGDDTTRSGAGTGTWPDQDRAAVGLCARRPAVLRRRTAGRRLLLQPRPRWRASGLAHGERSPGSCRPMAMPGSRRCMVRRGPSPVRSPKSRVGRIIWSWFLCGVAGRGPGIGR